MTQPASQPATDAADLATGQARPKVEQALLRYRVMAFVTGFLLLAGTTAWILKDAVNVKHMEPGTGLLWMAHGWMFIVYVLVTASLGVKLGWPIKRYALVMVAGTVPTMSFVAEHFVTREVRARLGR